MSFGVKTKIWNQGFFVFILLIIFSFGFLAIADEQEAITAYFEDTDQDGLSIDEEKAYGTDPTNQDTDGDSYSDGVEIESGYDPLKPAPGDRVVPEDTVMDTPSQAVDSNSVNLTDIASQELANLVAAKQEAQEELTNEDLSAAVSSVLEKANEPVELPEVDMKSIKVKKVDDDLDDKERESQQRQDTLEYLTSVSYILLSNSPSTIRSDRELVSFTERATQEAVASILTGNFNMVESLEQKSETVLKEIENIEVPENMVDTHLKAVQLVKFLGTMSQQVQSTNLTSDPIGQMAELAKAQGAMLEIQNFVMESQQKLTDLGIKNIPLDI